MKLKKFIENCKLKIVNLAKRVRWWTWVSIGVILLLLPIAYFALQNPTEAGAEWYDPGWAYRKKITIANAGVSGSTDFTDFTIAIIETSDTDLRDHAQSDGDDILFTDNNGRKLNHEIEEYTSANADLSAWVKVPTLYASEDTVLWMYYGNPSASNQQNPQEAWDENFIAVHHLEETTGSETFTDSTAHNNDSTSVTIDGAGSDPDAAGIIDGAVQFDGDDDDVTLGDKDEFSINHTNLMTVTVWVNHDDLGETEHYVSKHGGGGSSEAEWAMWTLTNGSAQCRTFQAGGGDHLQANTASSTISTGTWYFVAMTADLGSPSLKCQVDDGTPVEDTTASGSYTNTAGLVKLAEADWGGQEMDGFVDEVTISNTNRSEDWVDTTYNTQNHVTSAFYTLDTQETGGGPTGWWKFEDGQGSTAQDTTPNNNDATMTGGTWQTEDLCVEGKCMYFDNSDDVATVTNANSIDMDGTAILFGNGFEGGDTNLCDGGDNWTSGSCSGATTFVGDETTTKYDGTYGAKTVRASGASEAKITKNLGSSYDTLYTKFNFYLDAEAWGNNQDSVIVNYGTSDFDAIYITLRQDGSGNLELGAFDGDDSGTWAGSDSYLSLDTWYEIVFKVEAHDTDGVMEIWLDGTLVHRDLNANTGSGTGLQYVDFGVFWGTSAEVTAMFDNFEVWGQDNAAGWTYATWMKANSDGENSVGEIFDKGTNTYMRTTNEGADGKADLEAKLDLEFTDATVTVTNGLTLNKWHHVAMTYANDTDDEMTVYIDGKSRGTSTNGSGSPDADANNLLIGGSSTANFHGFIDEFKVYPHERTKAQIKADVAGGQAVFGDKTDWLSNGLVGYWNLDETSGNAADSSGNATTLTNVDTTAFSAAKFGNGAESDGAADYFDVADNATLSLTGDITLAAWIEPDDVTSHSDHIIGKWDTTSLYSYQLIKVDDEIRMYIDSSSNYETTDAANLAIDTLYHVAGVYDSSAQTVQIYVNGSLEASTTTGTIPSSIGDDAGEFSIGAEQTGGTPANYFDGHIDEARIYNRALSPGEVVDLYNWAPGPVGHWKMDENTGTGSNAVKDTSGNANHGTTNGTMTETDWVPGKYGSALDFDGSDDYISITETSNYYGISTISITGWFYLFKTADDEGHDVVINYNNHDTSPWYSWQVYTEGSADVLFVEFADNSNNVESLAGSTILATDQWYHYAATYNSGDIKLYLNGIDESTTAGGTPTSGNIKTPDGPILLGGGVSGKYPTALLDDHKIYNYVRTPQQIVEDMNAGHPTGGSPIGTELTHWGFDETYGTTANDSVNAKSLTLSASSWTTSGKLSSGFAGATNTRLTRNDDADLDFEAAEGFSITGWFKRSTISNDEYLVYKENGFEGYTVYVDSSGDVIFGIGDTSSGSFPEESIGNIGTDYDDDAWHHYAAVKNGTSSIKLYVDGVEIASDTSLAVTATLENSGKLIVGDSDEADGTDEFLGTIDEVKIYSSALTADQVLIDMNYGSAASYSVGQDEADDLEDGAGSAPAFHFSFDENSGTSTVNDISGNANTGTMQGSMTETDWVQGRHGSALDFDGSNDYISTTTQDASPPNDLTVEAWMKTTTAGGVVVSFEQDQTGTSSANYDRMIYIGTDGKAYFGCYDGSADVAVSTSTVNDGEWHHLVGTANDTDNEIKIYVDGMLNQTTANNNCQGFTGYWRVGSYKLASWTNGADAYFTGLIDEVKVYEETRTAAQIAYDYNRGKPIGWWKLDECQGATAYDSSGNSNDGTITPDVSGTHTSVGSCGSTTATEMWDDGATGKRNYSLDFDGTNDYVDMNDVAILDFDDADFTIAGWFNRETFTTDDTIVAKKNDQLNSSAGFVVWIDDSSDDLRLVVSDGDSANIHTVDSNTTFTSTGWNHFVISYDDSSSSGSKIYINGRRDGEGNTTIGTFGSINDLSNAVDFRIGSESDGGVPFAGELDDIQIYNYALSAAQAKKVFNESAVRFGPASGSP